MRFVYGLVGAILGTIVGGAATILLLAAIFGSDDFGEAFFAVIFGWIGLLIGAIIGVVVSQVVWHRKQVARSRGANWRKVDLSLLCWIALPILVAWGMLWGSTQFGQPPRDEALLENFALHRTEFDQLAKMAEKDQGLRRVDKDWTDPDNPWTIGVSDQRIVLYRRLLKQADVPRGFATTPNQTEVDFYYWGSGSAISSDLNKGYAYLTRSPAKTLQTLDGYTNNSVIPIEVYRHIDGNWYLFYEYEPD